MINEKQTNLNYFHILGIKGVDTQKISNSIFKSMDFISNATSAVAGVMTGVLTSTNSDYFQKMDENISKKTNC